MAISEHTRGRMADCAVRLRELLPLLHHPHYQETGEGRSEGKCLDEPCVSIWTAAREIDGIVATPGAGVEEE